MKTLSNWIRTQSITDNFGTHATTLQKPSLDLGGNLTKFLVLVLLKLMYLIHLNLIQFTKD